MPTIMPWDWLEGVGYKNIRLVMGKDEKMEQYLAFEYCIDFFGGMTIYDNAMRKFIKNEIGIDISGNTSKHMNLFLEQDVETVITVCGNADQACPTYPGQVRRYHWPFFDPAKAEGSEEEIREKFRVVRDEIQRVFSAYGLGRLDSAVG